jgi:hypothetical protein
MLLAVQPAGTPVLARLALWPRMQAPLQDEIATALRMPTRTTAMGTSTM